MNHSTTSHTLTLVSGGQTGADRAALDLAISRGIPHGGWCPKGRPAEDGVLPACYLLKETTSRDYLVRTERNVVDSDATIIFTRGRVSRGSKRTCEFAMTHGRPVLQIPVLDDSECSFTETAARIAVFVRTRQVRRLNVAGSRESKAPGIHAHVFRVLGLVLDDLAIADPETPSASSADGGSDITGA